MTKTSLALQQIRLLDILNLKSAGEGVAYYQPSPSSEEASCRVSGRFALVACLRSLGACFWFSGFNKVYQ
jgi:hypothetical protein